MKQKITKNKRRIIFFAAVVLLAIFTIALNAAYSAFTTRNISYAANIRVSGMEYIMRINDEVGRQVTLAANTQTIFEISITADNDVASRFELIYSLCNNSSCSELIDLKPEVVLEYSLSADNVRGDIEATNTRTFRIRVTNDSDSPVTLKFDVNAGFIHNTLAHLNYITLTFSETCADEYNKLHDALIACNTVRTNEPNFATSAVGGNRDTEEGMFRAEDIHGTSYFFRGTEVMLNNNVIFAGHQWRIIRVEGNGNIRLIYNGVCPNNECDINRITAGDVTSIGTSIYNPAVRHNRYSGYMFGSEEGTFDEQHANIHDSVVKQMLDNWFEENITGLDRQTVVDSVFCNDRTIGNARAHAVWLGASNPGTGLGTSGTAFGGIERLHQGVGNFSPSLICEREGDRLSLPVGLITADEVSMAGGRMGLSNMHFFLRSNQIFWTMTPGHTANAGPLVLTVNTQGYISPAATTPGTVGVRPVISLNADVRFSKGNGSLTNPFVIIPGAPNTVEEPVVLRIEYVDEENLFHTAELTFADEQTYIYQPDLEFVGASWIYRADLLTPYGDNISIDVSNILSLELPLERGLNVLTINVRFH